MQQGKPSKFGSRGPYAAPGGGYHAMAPGNDVSQGLGPGCRASSGCPHGGGSLVMGMLEGMRVRSYPVTVVEWPDLCQSVPNPLRPP